MKRIVNIFLGTIIICVCFIGLTYADDWNQTVFTDGVFTNTVASGGTNEVSLSSISGGNTWLAMTGCPGTVSDGGALVYPGSGNYIYALRRAGTTNFYRYSISGNSWSSMANTLANVGSGGSLVYPGSGDFIYAFRGNATTTFWRYSISGNSWSLMTSTPDPVDSGAALVYPGSGDYIYALKGGGWSAFFRYSISGNSWSAMTLTLNTISAGGSLVYPGSGDYIYAFRGGSQTSFYRYSISGNSWLTMASAPEKVSSGGSLVYPGSGDFIYAFRGSGQTDFWRYSISGNSWSLMANALWTVGGGGSLVYPGSGGYIYGLRGNSYGRFARYKLGGYLSPGTYISETTNMNNVTSWDVLTYNTDTPVSTTLTVDVLDINGDPIPGATNVVSGTNLNSIGVTIPTYRYIKLKANFSTSASDKTPTLYDWNINYTGGGKVITTSNWTALVSGSKAERMGIQIPFAKFDAVASQNSIKWESFRVDKSGPANNLVPDNKIKVSIWVDTNNNGAWDAADTMISRKRNFKNATVSLEMNYQMTTTPKTFFIVYDLSDNVAGGNRAGVRVLNNTYLTFTDAVVIGVD